MMAERTYGKWPRYLVPTHYFASHHRVTTKHTMNALLNFPSLITMAITTTSTITDLHPHYPCISSPYAATPNFTSTSTTSTLTHTTLTASLVYRSHHHRRRRYLHPCLSRRLPF
ncbi:hypothetical protein E2C01_078644 [Portunus trituberculatus]|uniref:Uncharacterized protein n=1 Tax=Portunus trituberculatus TaxID=210409 RepID=A0A5B7IEV2_PORTR|nr:hypothetical protein [Portunus trituberculatus]